MYFRIFCSLFNELIFSEFPVQQVILTLRSLKIYYLPVFESQEWEQCSWVVLAQGSHEVQLSVGAAIISGLDWNWDVCLQTHSYGSCHRDTNNTAARRDPRVQERDNKGPGWNTQFYISYPQKWHTISLPTLVWCGKDNSRVWMQALWDHGDHLSHFQLYSPLFPFYSHSWDISSILWDCFYLWPIIPKSFYWSLTCSSGCQNHLSNCLSTSSEISHRHYMACTMVSLNAPLNLKSTSILTRNTPHGIYLILPLDCELTESGHRVSVIWLFTVLNTVPSVK